MRPFKEWPKDWLKAGGALGLAILTARMTRTPLVTILSAMPLVLKHLRQLEFKQAESGGPDMSREEAALLLGVDVNATAEQVQEAHRRLIVKNHPDAGGTDYLAAKINQARDVLLA